MNDLISGYHVVPLRHVGTVDHLGRVGIVGSHAVLEQVVSDVLEQRQLVGEMSVGRIGGRHHDLTNARILVYRSAPAEVSLMMCLSGYVRATRC